MLTKRFSPKAGHYTALLSEVQAEMAALRKKLAALDARERSLRGFLLPFYEEGKFDVSAEGAEFRVNYSSTTRSYLDQNKAKATLAKLGKKVPTFTTSVVNFRVTKSK